MDHVSDNFILSVVYISQVALLVAGGTSTHQFHKFCLLHFFLSGHSIKMSTHIQITEEQRKRIAINKARALDRLRIGRKENLEKCQREFLNHRKLESKTEGPTKRLAR